jgi:hypothetical protein
LARICIHLHCLVLDGVYQRGTDVAPDLVEAPAPTDEVLKAALRKIITRTMKPPTRRSALVEEQGQTYMTVNHSDSEEARAQVAAGRRVYLAHRFWPACRASGADAAGRDAQEGGLQADPVR